MSVNCFFFIFLTFAYRDNKNSTLPHKIKIFYIVVTRLNYFSLKMLMPSQAFQVKKKNSAKEEYFFPAIFSTLFFIFFS